MKKNPPTTFRLNPHVEQLLELLAKHELTNRTNALETAIKEAATKRKIKIEATP